MELRTIKFGIIMVMGILIVPSCYNDNYQDLYPSAPCDTTQVTYSVDVWPVLKAQCTGCHSGDSPGGNVALENYNDVVIVAKNGKLVGSVRHNPGYSPMPKDGAKLSSCKINKIEKWVNDGTPNN